MPDVRYVCVSDLHFGAENSVLTNVVVSGGNVTVDPTKPSLALVALVDCLRALVHANEERRLPQLVLNGDILELALATDNVAATAFQRFVELAFDPADPVFDKTIVYVPGNHDHHLWETAREKQYAGYVRRRRLDEPLAPPWHATMLFAPTEQERVVESELLAAVLARMGRPDLRLVVHYPNFALAHEDRVVLFHHGHFVESMYLLMSQLKRVVFPAAPPALEAWDWEGENFAWIDFFWSTLGRSGDIGSDVGLIYDMLRSDEARSLMAGNVATAGAGALRVPAFVRPVSRWVIGKAIDRLMRRTKRLEREQTGAQQGPLSPSSREGLRRYVEGPVTLQLMREHEHLPQRFAFVFGHTHKPFEELHGFGGYGDVEVYNSGGWVVDTLAPEVRQGGAAILLDERLDVASLRLYNQRAEAPEYRVEVAPAPGGVDTAFRQRLAALVGDGAGPWDQFSAAIAETVPQRCQALGLIIQHGIALLKERPLR